MDLEQLQLIITATEGLSGDAYWLIVGYFAVDALQVTALLTMLWFGSRAVFKAAVEGKL